MTDTTAGEGVDAIVRRWANWIIDESADRDDVSDHDAGKRKIRAERDAILKALAAQPSAGAQGWTGYCRLCGTARKVSPCHKCSVPLSPLMADHEEPDLPDIEQIRTLAAEVGYAVGVHGSMERDLDVIAAPWVETAVSAPDLAAHLAKGLNARLLNDKVQDKPCGRWSCCIQIDGWFKHIDLSVCATPAQPDTGDVAALREATGGRAVVRDGQIVISIDVDALPMIVSGSCATYSLRGLWKVTDAEAFAKDVCVSLNAESENGTTRVHTMFDGAFDHAIEQGAEGVDAITEDEFEVEASRLRLAALSKPNAPGATEDGGA